jgi:hypothetical protein
VSSADEPPLSMLSTFVCNSSIDCASEALSAGASGNASSSSDSTESKRPGPDSNDSSISVPSISPKMWNV